MARKKTTSDIVTELRKLLTDKKLIIGKDRTLKNLKTGKVSKVFVSVNCPSDWKEDLKYYCGFANIELKELTYPNDELGTICKKPFSISVMGVMSQ